LRKVFLILIFISFWNCQNNSKKSFDNKINNSNDSISLKQINNEIIYYPSKESFEAKNLAKISLNNSNLDFKELINLIDKIRDKDSIPYLELTKNDTVRKIIPFHYSIFGLVKLNNILRINKDSILIDNHYSISNLEKSLKKFYKNNGKNPNYSDNPESAIIEIKIDSSENISALNELLIKLTKLIEKINSQNLDTIKAEIFLNNKRLIPRPAPPSIEIGVLN
tara:strand:- start:48 stop:716 length:669 start_codon:yes stop_codon:yes gene_type:complete